MALWLLAAPLWAHPAHAGVAQLQQLKKIAVVDVQRCILETREGKRAKTELQESFAKSQARLDRKAKSLRQRADDLKAKVAMLSDEERTRRYEELMRSEAELQELSAKLQQDIMEKEALLTEKIYKKVAAIVKQAALEEKIQVVLVRSHETVLYVNPQLDLTNRVILAYDKQHD